MVSLSNSEHIREMVAQRWRESFCLRKSSLALTVSATPPRPVFVERILRQRSEGKGNALNSPLVHHHRRLVSCARSSSLLSRIFIIIIAVSSFVSCARSSSSPSRLARLFIVIAVSPKKFAACSSSLHNCFFFRFPRNKKIKSVVFNHLSLKPL